MKSLANMINLKPNVFIASINQGGAWSSIPVYREHQKYQNNL